jgi:hypothetical protein
MHPPNFEGTGMWSSKKHDHIRPFTWRNQACGITMVCKTHLPFCSKHERVEPYLVDREWRACKFSRPSWSPSGRGSVHQIQIGQPLSLCALCESSYRVCAERARSSGEVKMVRFSGEVDYAIWQCVEYASAVHANNTNTGENIISEFCT